MNIKDVYQEVKRPIKILQFGEGNFLRAFVDYIIQKSNEKGLLNTNVCIVQPLANGLVSKLKEQNGLYTLFLQGIKDSKPTKEKHVINSLGDFINPYEEYQKFLEYARSNDLELIISNTTEAGIVLDKEDLDFSKCPNSYPGKLLSLLHERYTYFNGDYNKGLFIVPCELIDNNGDTLKDVLNDLAKLKGYDNNFIAWLNEANNFYNTLVDRIVPGYPRDQVKELEKEIGYSDQMMVKAEIFLLWVIQGNEKIKKVFPVDKANLGVHYVENIKPYKERKVKILNGSHTCMVPVSYLYGIDTVRESVEDPVIGKFVREFIFDEVVPTIKLPKEDMEKFANDVLDRYKNPFVRHELLSISLNSMTKYKTRILPTVLDNLNKGNFPKHALFSLASLIYFYRGKRNDEIIPLKDDEYFLNLYKKLWSEFDGTKEGLRKIAHTILSLKEHFGVDLTSLDNVLDYVTESLYKIHTLGMKKAVLDV